jgi:FkbM family methyltransferase
MLKSVAKKVIPEGKLKQTLRHIYRHFMFYNISRFDKSVSITHDTSAYTYSFIQNPINGVVMKFPNFDINPLFAIPIDLPGYFDSNHRNHKVFIDAGGFPGDYSMAVAQLYPNARIIALEPDPLNREYMNQALRMNNLQNKVEVLPYAISNKSKTMNIRQNQVGSHLVHLGKDDGKPTTKVKTRTIEDLLSEISTFPSSEIHIKMDIEGAEVESICASKNILKYGINFSIAAYHIMNNKRKSYELLMPFFEEQNYKTLLQNPRHLTLIASRK